MDSDCNWREIVGESPALKRALELVNTAAQTNIPVLIVGESGAGKEVIARAIHLRSRGAYATQVHPQGMRTLGIRRPGKRGLPASAVCMFSDG